MLVTCLLYSCGVPVMCLSHSGDMLQAAQQAKLMKATLGKSLPADLEQP